VTPQCQELNEPRKKHAKTTPHVVPTKPRGFYDLLMTQVTIEIIIVHFSNLK